MWDDCMSFPFMLVKVMRYNSISVKFSDAKGKEHFWENLPLDVAELVQHEVDHLDGILAVDRMVG